MNINDLPQGSYTEVQPQRLGNTPLNINSLPQGSYTDVTNQTPDQPTQSPMTAFGGILGTQGSPIDRLFQSASRGELPGGKIGQAIGTLGGYVASGFDKNYDTSAPTPSQVTGDAARVLGTVGALSAAPATIPGAIAEGAASGALTQGGEAAVQGKSGREVLSAGAGGAAVGGATAGAIAGIGQLLGKFGEKEITSMIKPSKVDMEDGFSIDTIKKYDLGGSLRTVQDKTDALLNKLSIQLKDTLGASDQGIDLAPVFDQTEKDVTQGKSLLKGFGANTRVSNALNNLQNEVLAVNPDGTLPIPDAQVVKQAAGHFGAWQYGRPDPEAKASEIVYNAFYRNLKTAIEDASPAGIKEINKQISELIPVSNAVVRRMPVAARNAAISLTDFITLTASALEPRALGVTLLGFLSKSGAVANQLMKAGPRFTQVAPAIGSGLQRLFNNSSGPSTPTQEQPAQ